MRFREFLEALDVMGPDVSDYQFDQSDEGSYEYNFTVRLEDDKVGPAPSFRRVPFTVYIFKKTEVNIGRGSRNEFVRIPDTYSVEFKDKEGYRVSGKLGTKAFQVYREVMLAIRAFMEQHKVNALHFTEFDERTKPIYHMFYKSYLQPDPPRGAGFLKIASNVYVSKDYIVDNPASFPRAGLGMAKETEEQELRAMAGIKSRDAKRKRARAQFKSRMGKPVRLAGRQPDAGIAVLSDKGSFGVIAWYTKLVKSLSGDYRLVMAYIPEDHAENFLPVFDLESTPTDAEVEEFVRRAASSPDIGPNDPSSSHALSKLPDDINARVIDAARQKA